MTIKRKKCKIYVQERGFCNKMIKKDWKKIYRKIRKIEKELKKIGKIIFKMTKRSIKTGIKIIVNKCLTTIENFKKYSSLDCINREIGEFLKLFTILGLPIYEFMVFSGLMESTTFFTKAVDFTLMPALIWGIYKCMALRYNEKVGDTPTIDKERHDLNIVEDHDSLDVIRQLSREKDSASSVIEEQNIDLSSAFEDLPSQDLSTAFEEVPTIELQGAFEESESLDFSRAFISEEQTADQNNTLALVRRKNKIEHE